MAKTKTTKQKPPRTAKTEPEDTVSIEDVPELVEEVVAPPSRLTEVLAGLKKQFGSNAIRTAAEIPDIFRLRRPTGVPMLDLILKGGFPAGGPSQIIGEEGAGKTDLSWRVMAEAQKNYGSRYAGVMASVEHWPDKSQARFAGLQLAMSDAELRCYEEECGYEIPNEERLLLTQDIGHTEFVTNDSTESLLDLVVAMYASGEFQVIVVDSVGAMFPAAELNKDLDEASRVAALANVLTVFMKKLWAVSMQPLPDGRYNETTLLILNQYREQVNMSNPRMSNMRIGGGRALKHGKLVDLLLKRTSWIYGKDGDDKTKIGKVIGAQVLKGKAGMPEGATCEWDFLLSSGIDTAGNWLTFAMYHGLCTGIGSYFKFWDSDAKAHGKHLAKIEAFARREAMLQELRRQGKLPSYRLV